MSTITVPCIIVIYCFTVYRHMSSVSRTDEGANITNTKSPFIPELCPIKWLEKEREAFAKSLMIIINTSISIAQYVERDVVRRVWCGTKLHIVRQPVVNSWKSLKFLLRTCWKWHASRSDSFLSSMPLFHLYLKGIRLLKNHLCFYFHSFPSTRTFCMAVRRDSACIDYRYEGSVFTSSSR